MIDIRNLPREVADIITIKEQVETTFTNFCDSDYTDYLFNLLAERSDPSVEHSFISSVYGLQGCHAAGTKIITKNGVEDIQNIVSGTHVWTGSSWESAIRIEKGIQETLEITLQNGIVFNMTSDHVMFTQRGEVEASNLVLGDVFQIAPIVWSDVWDVDSERAAVVAMLLADGHLDVRQVKELYTYERISNYKLVKKPKKFYMREVKRIRFYKSDEFLRSYFKSMIIKHFGAVRVGEYIDYGTDSTKVVCITRAKVFDAVVEAGVLIGKKSSIVTVPSWILNSDAAMNGFISAYIACDGHVNKHNIEIYSCSKSLIEVLSSWLLSRGIINSVRVRVPRCKNSSNLYVLSITHPESYNNLLQRCKFKSQRHKWSLKNTDSFLKIKTKYAKILKSLRNYVSAGKTYAWIGKKYNMHPATVHKLVNNKNYGFVNRKKNTCVEYYLKIVKIQKGEKCSVFDLHVQNVHRYVANGVLSHNSGKSLSMISLCCYLDPDFSIDKIYFSYDDLVHDRQNLKPNSAVLVDEQSQSYGMDSHRVMIILSNLKEQLRKKSIHFFFCAPTLYEESKSSMYLFETMFIDYSTKEAYAAFKTREGYTLGHVRIPHPLKVLEDGTTLATSELIDAYQKKKDAHLERVLGQSNIDRFQERAQVVMDSELFKKLEKLYVAKMGYIPQSTLLQVINKLFPEYRSGVVPYEIAGRIKLEKELAGHWFVSGRGAGKAKAGKK